MAEIPRRASSLLPQPASTHSVPPSDDSQRGVRTPGPGLVEAMFWVLGVVVAQAFGLLIVMAMLTAALLLPGGGVDIAALAVSLRNPAFLAQLQETFQVPLFAGSQVIFVAIVLIAARLRLGRQAGRLLATSRLLPGHAGLIVLAVLPLSILSTKTYVWFTMAVWEPLKGLVPALEEFDGLNSMAMLNEMVQTTPIWILLLSMAVVPALAEELVFRGIIGRGLIARWGVPVGVLITSVMFAAMHVHPAHVVGVIPLGIAMHFVYLATRSFWAPVLFHLLNNTVAVFSARVLHQASIDAADAGMKIGLTPVDLSAGWVLASVSCAAAIGLRLWSTRVRYCTPEGDLWSPGYRTVEAPPLETLARRMTLGQGDWSFALVVVSVVVFVTASFMAVGGV